MYYIGKQHSNAENYHVQYITELVGLDKVQHIIIILFKNNVLLIAYKYIKSSCYI